MQEKNKINTEISERILQVIDFHGDNKNIFAQKLGYNRSQTIYDIVNGKSAPSYDFFNRFTNSEYSETTNLEWLISGNGEMEKTQIVNNGSELEKYKKGALPLIPASAMAGFANGDIQIMAKDVLDTYIIPLFANRGAKFLILVSGSSMVPKYRNGDLLACRPVTDTSFFQWGKVYVLDTDQGPIIKRLFECKTDKDCVECRSENGDQYPPFKLPISSIRAVATVVGIAGLE
ncbi:MAG: S24 family peptidase [Daejeonella sp.]